MEDFLKDREEVNVKNVEEEAESSRSNAPVMASFTKLTGSKRGNEQVQRITPDDNKSPKVELISEDGVVTRILISCTCGKCLQLECEY